LREYFRYTTPMRLITLGELKLENSSFARLSPLLLLAFLALENRQSRRDVAELFWLGYKNPLSNLSMALSHLRKLNPDLVHADKHWVEARVDCDALDFLSALPNQEALSLYTGSFLDGLYFDDLNSELQDWILEKREYLAKQVQSLLLERAEQSFLDSDLSKATDYFEQAYELKDAGQLLDDQLKTAYKLSKSLQHPSLDELLQRIKDNNLVIADIEELKPSPVISKSTIPQPPLPLIGRKQELAELLALFESGNRLVTIIGPSGVGKSRLAIELSRYLEKASAFKDGVFYVSLFDVKDFQESRRRAGPVLGLSPQDLNRSEEAIRSFFKDKEALFVLDSVDDLLNVPSYLQDFMKRCLKMRVLTTSEERLRFAEEQLYPIKGLSFSSDEKEESPALLLFEQRAKRVDPKFSITPPSVTTTA